MWKGFAIRKVVGGLTTSGVPGQLFEAVYTEAMSTLGLDRPSQHLETLLTFVFILHGH